MIGISLSVLLRVALGWRSCDVTSQLFGAVGDGITKDSLAIRTALQQCDTVLLPYGKTFLSGPLNVSSNQELVIDGTLLASTDRHDYNLVAPLMGYGWGDDQNCFSPDKDKHKVIMCFFVGFPPKTRSCVTHCAHVCGKCIILPQPCPLQMIVRTRARCSAKPFSFSFFFFFFFFYHPR